MPVKRILCAALLCAIASDVARDVGVPVESTAEAWRRPSGSGLVGLSLDFTVPVAPSGVTISRTGGSTAYPALSSSTTQATTGAIYENRGDPAGGGWWTFPPFTNQVTAPTNHADVSWTNFAGTVVVTAAATTSPDGTTHGDQLLVAPANAAANNLLYFGSLATNADRIHSGWVKDAVPAPSIQGALIGDGFPTNQAIEYPGGWGWQRTFPVFSVNIQIQGWWVTGYEPWLTPSQIVSASGAIDVWGDSMVVGTNDYPLVIGSTNAQTIEFSPTLSGQVIPNGDLDLEGTFINRDATNGNRGPTDTGAGVAYVFSASTPDGLLALRFDDSTNVWTLTVRGVDQASTILENSWAYGKLKRFRVWYKPSTGAYGFRITTNNCTAAEASGVATGSALRAPTDFWLGSNLGAANYLAGQWTSFKTYINATNGPLQGEFVLIGDSIVEWPAHPTHMMLSGAGIYTTAEAAVRPGIVTLARGGETIQQQQTRYDASYVKGASYVTAIVNQVGINNILNGDSAVTIEGLLQGLINDERTGNPSAKLVLAEITPARSGLTAGQYAVWQAVNAWITGGAPVNTDAICTANSTNLNDGSDNLKAWMNSGDGIHPYDNGRGVHLPYSIAIGNQANMADGWRGSLVSLGLLPN